MDKVNKFFDDSQITNVNMIQTLMKQMTSRMQGGNLFNPNDQLDINSLLGGIRQSTMLNDGYSNADTFNNSFYDASLRKSSMFGVGPGNQFVENGSEYDRSNYGGVESFVPSLVDAGDQEGISKLAGSELNDSFRAMPRGQVAYGYSYKNDISYEIRMTKPVFRGNSRFFILKSNTMQNMEMSQQHSLWATTLKPTRKLQQALASCDNVILIFSVNESSHFQGIARMETGPNPKYKAE